MKQEYIDKMNYYQGKEYENFLREKCVLDARQFLFSSQLYLNYASITEKLYEDIGKKNISESEKNRFIIGKMRLFVIYVQYIIMGNIHLTYMEVHHLQI